MKNLILITTVAFGLLAGPALAQSAADASIFGSGTLTQDQRDALIAVLSGLPRQ